MAENEVHVVWVLLLQALQRTEPFVCVLEVTGFKYVGHVYLLLDPGLLSTSLASISRRGMLVGKALLVVEKMYNVYMIGICPGDQSRSRALETHPRMRMIVAVWTFFVSLI